MITAQQLYDRQDEIGGDELHRLFNTICNDPSPRGAQKIDRGMLWSYAQEMRRAKQDPLGNLRDVAVFCESFIR